MATFVDPRKVYKSILKPDVDPSGRQDASGANTPAPPAAPPAAPPGGSGDWQPGAIVHGDPWQSLLNAINASSRLSQADKDLIAGSQSKLMPMFNAAGAAYGGLGGVIAAARNNPLKAAYTALSYLTGTPYYDRGNDPNSGRLFKIPGFDYGTVDDAWAPTGTYGQGGYWT